MIPYAIDPSLHDSAPAPETLGDGFSRPQPHEPQPDADPSPRERGEPHPEAVLSPKSPF